jgi:ribonuclease D
LADAIHALNDGEGPVAVDSERASGFRYGQRAQLVQMFRRGTGVILIDPVALPDLSAVTEALRGVEWVFHAASQDLPCLRECGLEPDSIFDTEMAARLLGHDHVGLAAVIADTLGYGLAKEFSAQDWSVRPLPESWLNYAALDVAVLVDARDVLERELVDSGKLDIAHQEFQAALDAPPPAPRPDPWRRTHGLHTLRERRQLGVARALWEARDRLAQKIDVAPTRVLPDAGITAAAKAMPSTPDALGTIHPFGGRNQSRRRSYWWRAVDAGRRLNASDLPPFKGPAKPGPPPVRSWSKRHPQAAERMTMVKAAVAELSEELNIPVENLMQPELLRTAVFEAPTDVPELLADGGARPWQIAAISPLVTAAIEAYPGE